MKSSNFLAFEKSYRGGVNIATGWVAGELGGFSRIIAGKKSGSSTVSVFSGGSALTGHPKMYLMPANHYMQMSTFEKAAEFEAFPGSTSGVDVTSSSAALTVECPPSNSLTCTEQRRWTPHFLSVNSPSSTCAHRSVRSAVVDHERPNLRIQHLLRSNARSSPKKVRILLAFDSRVMEGLPRSCHPVIDSWFWFPPHKREICPGSPKYQTKLELNVEPLHRCEPPARTKNDIPGE